MRINMFHKGFSTILCGVLVASCATQPTSQQRAAAQINESVYRALVAEMASDAFEGRAPGSPGEARTVEFLEREFQELGLRPANGASFRQEVPLVEITAVPADARLAFQVAGQRLDLALADDMVVGTRRVQPASSVADSDVVFVGYGIVAPEYGWNDYEGLDMRGKTALILVNDPGFATEDPELFRGRAMTYYGRWTYKFEEAARQGAAAAIIIHDTAPAAYPWAVVRNGWTGPQFYLERADGNAGRSAIEGWITLDRARELMALSGQDLDALSLAARQRGFRPVPLAAKADAGVRNLIRRAKSPNVAAVMPGTTRPDEYVIYVAHWDHLGRALALGGDTIFNGAQDNATGVAGILAIARAFRSLAPPPERSILFLSVTAEESGLIGSEFYAANPLVPLETTAAVINIDSLAPLGRARDLQVIGFGASELEDLLREAAAAQGRVLAPDSSPEAGYFYRSDHVNLAKVGVPALYIKSGTELRGQPAGEGQRRADAYFNSDYHKQTDDYREDWDVSGSIEDLTLLFEVGARVASGGTWPNWYLDNEFRAARDQSAAQRGR
ncbi:MAG: M28 family metallopeptidase [Steroidobacteraceae bacterium]